MFDLDHEIKELERDTKRVEFLSDIKPSIDARINEKYSHYKFASDKIIKKSLSICNDNYIHNSEKQQSMIENEIDSLIEVSIALSVIDIEAHHKSRDMWLKYASNWDM